MLVQQKDSETIVSEIARILERGRTIQFRIHRETIRENFSPIEKHKIEAASIATEEFIDAIEMYRDHLERRIVKAEEVLKLVSSDQLNLNIP
jgi:hypothetical protein